MPKSKTYEEFIEKFKPKKTTDDCYTPDVIYKAVKDWAIKEMDWGGRTVVRPFWPGGNFENYDYPEGCVVSLIIHHFPSCRKSLNSTKITGSTIFFLRRISHVSVSERRIAIFALGCQ